ncbi:AP2/B3 transcriptional factor family protein [Hibiscus syriacus]|uniref:AP2/B3 transcriptional factor family protein n=1 Tax=Hibiscus syriacus TaxID=106335 RepID=A0A6A2ZN64_HIBSY|nr:uncharacterized protein LOC120141601 [Hibiscus syriacus]KAE8693454.1 AP2/B3 transcriptional factor family protein [Hibiscus syriacus]
MNRVTMAAFSSKSTKKHGVRSVSFPARSHPSTLRLEEELNKRRCWQGASSSSNAETLCTGLFGLAELYICIEDLLNLPLTRQALAQHHSEEWENALLDCSLKHLDLCGNTRDAVLSMKQSARELQSALRRSKAGELSIESNISGYISCRKNMKREIANSLASLKQMDDIFGDFPLLDQNRHLFAVAELLKEASLITASIFHTLLSFLSPSRLKPKPSKWSLVSKLVRKGSTDEHKMNELDRVDVAVSNLLMQGSKEDSEEKRFQSALLNLESLDGVFESF